MYSSSVVNKSTDNEMFSLYVDKIRKEVGKAADCWFNIAYYVYEMNFFGYYKDHFNNIVDCCLMNFGFKKSTTYNFINIVEQFSVKSSFTVGMVKSKPVAQYVTYGDFFKAVKSWSYSQLVAMLSLSDKQRELASPDMSVRDIKKLKTEVDSKRLEYGEISPVDVAVPADPDPAPAEIVVPADPEPAPADITVPDVPEPDEPVPVSAGVSEADELRQSLENALDDISRIRCKYDSSQRELQDMITARDTALFDLSEAKDQIKKLKADNKKLRAEVKALKAKSS